MDKVMKHIQGDIPWCLLLADDVVLMDETGQGWRKRKLELWLQTLESKGYRISRTKSEYLRCDFSGVMYKYGDFNLEGQIAPKRDIFIYCCKAMEIPMRMFATRSRLDG
jgi:hypothetical protein